MLACLAPPLPPRSQEAGLDGFVGAEGHDGTYGRIACLKSDFDKVGGYNEALICLASEDRDLIDRLELIGNVHVRYQLPPDDVGLQNSKEEGMLNSNMPDWLRALPANEQYVALDLHNQKLAREHREQVGSRANTGKPIGVPDEDLRRLRVQGDVEWSLVEVGA